MKLSFLVFVLLAPFISLSQIIDNSRSFAFGDDPFYNSAFIKTNQVKSIHGIISTKKELSAIKKTNQVIHFEFNEKGELIKQYKSVKRHKKIDTTFTMYSYSDLGGLVTKRTNDAHGFYSYNYGYNKQNQRIKKTYCRDENVSENKNNFVLGKQYTIINETYSYKLSSNTLLKNIYNNNGRIYEKHEFTYDSLGYLIKINKKLLINNKKSSEEYEYNEHGLIKSVSTFKVSGQAASTKTTYQYDEFGNLTYIDEYKEGNHQLHKELLYEPSTYMLKALITQDLATNFITIIKFTTIFR